MFDHKDSMTMTMSEKHEQSLRDSQAARAHVAQRFMASTTPEDRAAASRVLDALGAVSLDELAAAIETDGHGNPLYHYGPRGVWQEARDITTEAQATAHTLRQLEAEPANQQVSGGGDPR